MVIVTGPAAGESGYTGQSGIGRSRSAPFFYPKSMCQDKTDCTCGCETNLAVNRGLPLTPNVRREGKHIVAPGVLAIAGVMNNALLPADEIKPKEWENVPLVLRHPRKDGAFVPWSTPGADTVKIGFVANVSFDATQRLRGEYWFDTEAISELPEGSALLARLESGQMIEQSTGYLHSFVANAGNYKGRSYRGIQRNVTPDHVAILPDDIGACSIADGCGVLQVNMAQTMQTPTDSVMVAFFLRPEDADKYALAAQDLPDGAEVVPPSQLHVTLAYLGKVADLEQRTSERQVMEILGGIARYEVFMPAEVQGYGRFISEDGENDPVWLSVGSADLHRFRHRLAMEISHIMPAEKHGFTPHITLAYVPKGATVEIPMLQREAISFDSIALAWGGRVSLFRLQGEQRIETGAIAINKETFAMEENKKPQDAATTAVTPTVVEKEVKVIAVNQQQLDELLGLAEAIKGAGGIAAITQQITAFAANQKAERDGLITALAANQSLGMTAEDLALLPTPTLQRMHRASAPTDYGLRNATFATNAAVNSDWEEYKAPTEADIKK